MHLSRTHHVLCKHLELHACIVTVVTPQGCASNSQCLQEDFGHPRAYASVFSFVAPLELDGSSLQCWMEVATWCRVQARCSLSRLPRVHQPRLIFTGSLARVANRDANEPSQNLMFHDHPSGCWHRFFI